MSPLEDVRAQILARIAALEAETIPLEHAHGRVLRRDVRARESMPPFDNSAMDGFLVRTADTSDARPDTPISLTVIGVIEAGAPVEQPLAPGEAYRIFTGAPLCPGDPAAELGVVPFEQTEHFDDGSVHIGRPVRTGQCIRRAGEDLHAGDIGLGHGARIHAASVGLLAMLGASEVEVGRRPRVAVHSSGNELIPVEAELSPGKIRNSNAYSLAARLEECGATAIRRPVLLDDPALVREGLEATLALEPDAIVTTGGVSAGDLDYIREVAREFGDDVTVRKVAMKPGKPLVDGTLAGVPFFGLPGNPAACLVSFEIFVRPALERMEGLENSERAPRMARVTETRKLGPTGRRKFLRGRVRFDMETTEYLLEPTGGQESHLMTSFASANCLVDVPADAEVLEAGQQVTIWPL